MFGGLDRLSNDDRRCKMVYQIKNESASELLSSKAFGRITP